MPEQRAQQIETAGVLLNGSVLIDYGGKRMDLCRTCERSLEPGYQFCHFCGTPIQQGETTGSSLPGEALTKTVDKMSDLGRSLGELKQVIKSRRDRLLGDPTSIRRRLMLALLASTTLCLLFGLQPRTLKGLAYFVEFWLLTAVVLIIPVSIWVVGINPASRVSSRILGDEFSTRRQMMMAGLLTLPLYLVIGWMAGITQDFLAVSISAESEVVYSPLFSILGFYLIALFLMGYSSQWRPVLSLEHSVSFDGMASKADELSLRVFEVMAAREIPGLTSNRVSVADLKHWTAGDTRGNLGHQMIFTSGRARIVLVVQDFGQDLFIRWSAYYDNSGRRLFVLFGVLKQAMEDFLWRWSGSRVSLLLAQVRQALSPASKDQVVLENRRGILASLGLSEYAWNDLYALEASIKSSVVRIAKDLVATHQEESEIRNQINRHLRNEGAFGRS